MTDNEFDATALLNATVSEEGAELHVPLAKVGIYNSYTVESINGREPFEDQKEKGRKLNVFVTWRGEGGPSDVLVTKFPMFSATEPTDKQAHGKLYAAIWPEAVDRVGKSVNDLIGEQATIVVTHDTFKGKAFADFAYMPADG